MSRPMKMFSRSACRRWRRHASASSTRAGRRSPSIWRFSPRFPTPTSCANSIAATAEAVRREAADWRDAFAAAHDPAGMTEGLLRWDAALKSRGINPGTSADLTVATLFAASLSPIRRRQLRRDHLALARSTMIELGLREIPVTIRPTDPAKSGMLITRIASPPRRNWRGDMWFGLIPGRNKHGQN